MVMSIMFNGQRVTTRHDGRRWMAILNGEVIETGFGLQLLAVERVLQAIQQRHDAGSLSQAAV